MRKIVLIVTSIFLISLASAEVVINMPNIVVQSGQSQTFSLTLQNNFNFSVFNFSFSNLTGFTFPQITSPPNSNQAINFNILRTDAGTKTINSLVSFKYNVDIPQGIKTYYINITNTGGFQPDSIIVRRGDTIVWTNKDTISRDVTSSLFDFSIQPSQSNSYTFTQLGSFPYQDLVLFFGGNVQVINETEITQVNNPLYNINLPVTLTINTNPTNISISNSKSDYTIDVTGEEDGYIILTNNGNAIAQSVHLSSDLGWISFDKNDFNLAVSESTSVNYHIRPFLYQTSDTNKTHILTLKANGANFGELDSKINVFVPYNNNFQDINTDEGAFALYLRICSENPTLLMCNNTISIAGNGTTTVQNPMINLNLSTEQFVSMLKRQQTLTDTVSRQGNSINSIQQEMSNQKNELSETKNLINQSLEIQRRNEKRADTWQLSFIFVLFFGIIFTAIILVLRKNAQYNQKRNILDSGVSGVPIR
jgi:hypothetical protein